MNAATFSDTSDGAISTARTMITSIPSQDVGDDVIVVDVVNGGYDGTSSAPPIKKIEQHQHQHQQYRPIEDNASNSSTTTPPITSPHASIHNNNNMNQHQHLIGSCVRSSTSSSSVMITDPSTTSTPPQDEDDDESIVGSTLFQNKITSTLSVKPKIDNQTYSDTTPIDATTHMLVDSSTHTFNKSSRSSSMHEHGHVGNVNHEHVSSSSNMTSTPPPTSSTQHVNMTSTPNVHACNNVDQQPTSSTLGKSKGGKSIKFQMENPSDPNYKSITQKSNYKDITLEDMSKYFHLPQTQAAEMLGVSLSTLKRRFYSFGIGRWPSYENNTSTVLANLSNLNSSMSPSTTTQSMSITTNNSNMTSSPHASTHSNVVNVVNDTTGHASNPSTSNLHSNALHVLAAASTNVTKNVSDVLPPPQDASQSNPLPPPTSTSQQQQIMPQTKVIMNTTQPPQHSTLNTAIRMSHPPNVNTNPTNTTPNTRVFTHEHHYVRHSPSTPPNEHPQSSKMYEEHDESIVQHYQQKTHAPQEVHIHHHHYHIYQQNNHPSEYYPHYSDKFMPSRHYPPPPSTIHHHHALEMGRPSSYSPPPPPPPYHSRSQQQYIGYSNSPNSPQREGINVHALNQTVVQGPKAQPVPVASHNQFKKSPLLDQLNPSETKEKTPSDSSETSYDDSNRRITKSYLYHPYQKQQAGGIHNYRPISPEQPPVVYSRHAPPSTLQPPPYYPYSSSSGSDFKTSGYPIGEGKYYQGNNSTSYHHYELPVPTHNVYSSTSATPPNPYYGSRHPYSNSPNWEDNSLRKEGNVQNNMGENPRQYHNSR